MSELASQPSITPGRYAAIDIGTVTCRLLIADLGSNGKMDERHRESIICNLGEGVDETGRLAPAAIERVGVAVDGFMRTLRDEERRSGLAIPVRAVATSASRDARNADDFAKRLARAGLRLEVIPGEREAFLSFMGASSSFPGERVVVVDSGGGSTEVIAGLAGEKPTFARSFNVGCRRVTERFFRDDPPSEEDLVEAAAWISAECGAYLQELRDDGWFEGRMVGVAGTATSVVSMREQMAVYDSRRVHGSVVTRGDLDEALDKLSKMTTEQRRHIVGLRPGRAPVIVGGLLILQQLMRLSGVASFTVSESDILQGIIMSIACEEIDASKAVQ